MNPKNPRKPKKKKSETEHNLYLCHKEKEGKKKNIPQKEAQRAQP